MLKISVNDFKKDILIVFHHRFKKLMEDMEDFKKIQFEFLRIKISVFFIFKIH